MADIILKCLSAIPRKLRRDIAIGMFRLFYYLSPRQRFITIHNLKRAFPEKSIKEIKNIARGSYTTLAITVADFFDIPSLTKDNIGNLVEIEGLEYYTKALEKNRGILLAWRSLQQLGAYCGSAFTGVKACGYYLSSPGQSHPG